MPSVTHAASYCVTTTKDHGPGSLRGAIESANRSEEPTEIYFRLSKQDKGYDKKRTCWRITPCSPLPKVKAEVHIDGFSQPHTQPNSHTMDLGNNCCIKVELCGPGMDHDTFVGLSFGKKATNSSVCGLSIVRCPIGIKVSGDNIQIYGCLLGVDAKGQRVKNNKVSIAVTHKANNTSIGGSYEDERMLVVGKGSFDGTSLEGAITNYGNNTTILGTTVNISRNGSCVLCPTACAGIVSKGCEGTKVGGTTLTERVVVAGHTCANLYFITGKQRLLSR